MRSNKYVITLFFILIAVSISSTALAAALVQPRKVHATNKFFTKKRIVALSIGAAMMTADVLSTQRALKVPGAREANPLGQSAGGRYALKLGGMAAGIGISYALHRSGHYKAARLVPIIIGIPSAAAAIHNSRIRK